MGRSSSSPLELTFYDDRRGSLTDTDEPLLRRELRRRKLDKVQRLLGERIPAGLVLADHPGYKDASAGMTRSNSRLGGIWKGLGFKAKRREGNSDAVEVDIEVEMEASSEPLIFGAGQSGLKKEATPVQVLARTRKIENVTFVSPPF